MENKIDIEKSNCKIRSRNKKHQNITDAYIDDLGDVWIWINEELVKADQVFGEKEYELFPG